MANTKTSLSLSGMTCIACEKIVSKRIRTIAGVEEVVAFSHNGKVFLDVSREITAEEIDIALQDTHYKVITNS